MNTETGLMMRVTGAWSHLLIDWLDKEQLNAPALRAIIASYRPADIVPFDVWRDLLDQAAALRPQQLALGLTIGTGVQARHAGVLGYLALASATLGDALNAYQRYERLFYGVDLARITFLENTVEICWPATPQSQMASEVSISALITLLRSQLPNAPVPTRLGFLHKADHALKQCYENFFGCPVTFDDTHTRVCFPIDYLRIAMPNGDHGLHTLLENQAESLLGALPSASTFDQAVQQQLLRMLPEGLVSVQKLASSLHQSTRTLQRRLAKQGLTWQDVLDRTRKQLAMQYLGDPALSIWEITILLGYSEQSAFTRAFRRWAGRTPLKYRAMLLGAETSLDTGPEIS